MLTTEASSDTAALDNNEENDDFLGIETSEASASDTVAVVEQTTNEDYKAAMDFTAKFKQERAEQGKRLDWIACMKEGKDILKYKNVHSFRNQFCKCIKKKRRKKLELFFFQSCNFYSKTYISRFNKNHI